MRHAQPNRPTDRVMNDAPALEMPQLGFDAYAHAIAGVVTEKENQAPYRIGIYGAAGSGKTTLMRAVQRLLNNGLAGSAAAARQCKTVWVDPSVSINPASMDVVLVEAIFKAMAADGYFGLAKARIDEIGRRIDQSKAFALIAPLLAGMDVSEFFLDLDATERLVQYDTFKKLFDDLVWTFLHWRFNLSGDGKPDHRRASLVLLVDNIDAIVPDAMLAMMDAVHRFTGRFGGIAIIAVDQTVMHAALNQCQPGDGERRIARFFQSRFSIPPAAPEQYLALLDDGIAGAPVIKAHLALLVPAVDRNPRQFKQYVNQLCLLNSMLHHLGLSLDPDIVARWSILQLCFSEAAAAFSRNPALLLAVHKQIKRLSGTTADMASLTLSEAHLESEGVPKALRSIMVQPELAGLIAPLDILPETLKELQRLTESTLTMIRHTRKACV